MALIRRISLFALAGALLCGSPPATAQGNWQQILPPGLSASYTYHFNDVYFLDETTGWIGGQQIISDYLIDALILKTTDGGRSWTFAKSEIAGVWNQLQPFDTENPLMNNHFFLNSCLGFIAGSDGNILKTSAAGQSWKNLSSGVADDLWDVCLLSGQVGFVVGEFDRILKTENGGEGWAGTESGLRYTAEGGESWQAVPLRFQHAPIRYIHLDQQGDGCATLHYYFEEEEGPGRPFMASSQK